MVFFDTGRHDKDPKAVGLFRKLETYLKMDVFLIISKLCLVFQWQDLDVTFAKVALTVFLVTWRHTKQESSCSPHA